MVRGISDLINYSSELGMRNTMVTNALPITESFCQSVSGSLDIVGISVHGLGERHNEILGVRGAFDKLINNIEILKKYAIPFGINFTVLETNSQQFEETALFFLERYQPKFVTANRYVGGHGKGDDVKQPTIDTLNKVLAVFERLEQRYPSVEYSYAIYFPFCLVENPRHLRYMKGCGLGSSFASVDFDGNMKLCSYSETRFTNVLSPDAVSQWRHGEHTSSYRSGDWIPAVCKPCELLETCLTGCRVSDASQDYGPDSLTKTQKIRPLKRNEEGLYV